MKWKGALSPCKRNKAPSHRQQLAGNLYVTASSFLNQTKYLAHVITNAHSFPFTPSCCTDSVQLQSYQFMDGPSLIVVPPTPLGYHRPSPSTTASSSPDISRLTSSEQERGSSETTIFTIYSMY